MKRPSAFSFGICSTVSNLRVRNRTCSRPWGVGLEVIRKPLILGLELAAPVVVDLDDYAVVVLVLLN